MKMNLSFELTDEQRNTLDKYLTGKERKRLATRAEIHEFLQGCLDRAMYTAPKGAKEPVTRHQFTQHEQAEIERLRAEGKDDSYIRGWLQVGRKQ